MAAQALTDMARGVVYPGPLTGTRATRALGGLKVRATARKVSIAGLVAAMALGSVALWTVLPAAVLGLISRLSPSSQLSVGICPALAAGIPTDR
jgi:hypothetical protein